MNFFTVPLWVISVNLFLFVIYSEEFQLQWEPRQMPESTSHEIEDCLFVTEKENTYSYTSNPNFNSPCKFYVYTKPKQKIEFTFELNDYPCSQESFVTFLDGWELNSEYFPAITDMDKELHERMHIVCGKQEKKFVSSQNAAMLLYWLPEKSSTFKFHFRFLDLPNPCNIFVPQPSGTYTLKNYGRRVNCSLIALFPTHLTFLHLEVGDKRGFEIRKSGSAEIGTMLECPRKGNNSDFVQIGNSRDLNTFHNVPAYQICGFDSNIDLSHVVRCGVTMVVLISSGKYHNKVSFKLIAAKENYLNLKFSKCNL